VITEILFLAVGIAHLLLLLMRPTVSNINRLTTELLLITQKNLFFFGSNYNHSCTKLLID